MPCARASSFEGRQVSLDVLSAHRPGIAGNVVGARKNHNHLGMQVDHILAEAHQHLRRSLSADPAVDVSLAGKVIFQLPYIGDRIAEKHHAILAHGTGAPSLALASR